jgi:hypothetical protein
MAGFYILGGVLLLFLIGASCIVIDMMRPSEPERILIKRSPRRFNNYDDID